MSNIPRWIFGLPAALAGLFISAFAGEVCSRIISWPNNHLWGEQSFKLNRGQPKRGHMLLAGDLEIKLSDKTKKLLFKECSRFPDALVLEPNKWLEIKATVDLLRLSPDTNYAAVLIFKLIGSDSTFNLLEASVSLEYHIMRLQWTKVLCTDPDMYSEFHDKHIGLPIKRSDGWMELEMGQFYCDGPGKVVVGLKEFTNQLNHLNGGLIVAGIDIRPTYTNKHLPSKKII